MPTSSNGAEIWAAQELRVLRLLSKAQDHSVPIRHTQDSFTLLNGSRKHTFDHAHINKLKRCGCIELGYDTVSLTEQGRLTLYASLQNRTDRGLAQADSLDVQEKTIHGQSHIVNVNIDESPLSRLYRLRKRDGAKYISDQEFMAGERFRADFHKARLEPRISANWSMTAGQAGKGGKSGASEISDIALDARKRFHSVLDKIGPELAGVLVDTCCFLKGLEVVERERKWPPRSAKLMLKTALGSLARYYGMVGQANQSSGLIERWGAEGYRPTI